MKLLWELLRRSRVFLTLQIFLGFGTYCFIAEVFFSSFITIVTVEIPMGFMAWILLGVAQCVTLIQPRFVVEGVSTVSTQVWVFNMNLIVVYFQNVKQHTPSTWTLIIKNENIYISMNKKVAIETLAFTILLNIKPICNNNWQLNFFF